MRDVAMVPFEKDYFRLRSFPVCGSEGVEVVAVRHSREAGEDVAQVSKRVDAAALARYDDRVDDRRTLAGIRVSYKQPVFLSDGRWPDGVFDKVVIEPGFAALQVPGQGYPVFEQVVAGFSQARFRPRLRPQARSDLSQPVEGPLVVFRTVPAPVGRAQLILIPARLTFVEPTDDLQDQGDRLRVFPLGVEKLPARVRPAAYPRLIVCDNIEDKGMTAERSRNFQRNILGLSKEAKTEHQIIFTTSMVDPSLDMPEYTIGPNYVGGVKTLDIAPSMGRSNPPLSAG